MQQTKLLIRGHLLATIRKRFKIKDKEKILNFLRETLKTVKINKASKYKIMLINEENQTAIASMQNKHGITLCTIYPLDQFSYYQTRQNNFKNLKTTDLSNSPLIFAGTDLQEKNIIWDEKEWNNAKNAEQRKKTLEKTA